MTTSQASAEIEIDGQSPAPEQLAAAALDSYGHFTAMQVRNHQVRGLGLHLARLTSAHLELFGADLDPAVVIDRIRNALRTGTGDASVRVYLRHREDQPSVMVTVRPPGEIPAGPWRLRAVPY